jgi:hypothetical protein
VTGRLTPGQRTTLAALANLNALSRESAATAYTLRPCHPPTLARLQQTGLSDSAVIRRPGGTQFTAYWLTPAGAAAAALLT